jgi:hypothetical protein
MGQTDPVPRRGQKLPRQYDRRFAAADDQGAGSIEQHHALAVRGKRCSSRRDQQVLQPLVLEVPVAYRAGVEMDETGMRVSADAAAPHRARRGHRLAKPGGEPHIERAAVKMLAILGNPEGGAG